MLDEESLVAVVADRLLKRLTAVRGMMFTARSQLEPDETQASTAELLRAADLDVIRMTVDLERLARGLSPLDVTVVDPDEDAVAGLTSQRTAAVSSPVP